MTAIPSHYFIAAPTTREKKGRWMSFARILRYCAPLAVAAFAAAPAWCTPIQTYSSASSWLAAVTGVTDITFTGTAGTNKNTNSPEYDAAGGSVKFSSNMNLIIYNNTSASYYNFGSDGTGTTGYLGLSGAANGLLDILLTGMPTAFGVELMTAGPNGATVSVAGDGIVTPYNVATQMPNGSTSSRTFFGLTSATPISHITISAAPYTMIMLDNFQFGTAGQQQSDPPADAPEATTMILIGGGLLGFTALRRRFA